MTARRKLRRSAYAGEHLVAHAGRGHRPGAVREPGEGFAELGHLDRAGLALGEVTLERGPLEIVHRVECVRPGDGVDVRARHGVTSTFKQSRSRISPSRMRVLIVGSAVVSKVATSR